MGGTVTWLWHVCWLCLRSSKRWLCSKKQHGGLVLGHQGWRGLQHVRCNERRGGRPRAATHTGCSTAGSMGFGASPGGCSTAVSMGFGARGAMMGGHLVLAVADHEWHRRRAHAHAWSWHWQNVAMTGIGGGCMLMNGPGSGERSRWAGHDLGGHRWRAHVHYWPWGGRRRS